MEGAAAGAPALAAVHCSGSSHKPWSALCDELDGSGVASRVVAPVLFGYGGTTPWPATGRPQTLDDSAALVARALEDAGEEEAPLATGGVGTCSRMPLV